VKIIKNLLYSYYKQENELNEVRMIVKNLQNIILTQGLSQQFPSINKI